MIIEGALMVAVVKGGQLAIQRATETISNYYKKNPKKLKAHLELAKKGSGKLAWAAASGVLPDWIKAAAPWLDPGNHNLK